MPHKIATLLYAFNPAGEVLLLERRKEPNPGLWSPPGGKLSVATGESPHACARREAREEIGVEFAPRDFLLTGIVSERGYEGEAHWLMFLFEIASPVRRLPPPNREGRFGFFPLGKLAELRLPETDRERIWPLFLGHRGGFFAARCACRAGGSREWTVEESRPGKEIKDGRRAGD